jgi:hypothetical protein
MDPHSFSKLKADPDPHSPKKLDPDPHKVNADPKHCGRISETENGQIFGPTEERFILKYEISKNIFIQKVNSCMPKKCHV